MEKGELLAHLKKQGITSEVVNAFSKIKREDFVPEHEKPYAYEDIALPLNEGQSISQPSTIAFMLDLLQLSQGQKILEIGSGSGYVLALLSEITKGEIYGLEINKELAVSSKNLLSSYQNIHIFHRDGSRGMPENEPFDRILISASAPDMDTVYSLIEQLKEEGIIVAPVKSSVMQLRKLRGHIEKKEFKSFAFVPLITKQDLKTVP